MSTFLVRYIVLLLYKIGMDRIAYPKLLDWKKNLKGFYLNNSFVSK